MTENQSTKTCSRCKAVKSTAEFTLRYVGPRGPHYRSQCKPCARDYGIASRLKIDREALNKRRRELYKEKPGYKQHARKWYQRNKEYFIEYRTKPENRERERQIEQVRIKNASPEQREKRLDTYKKSHAKHRAKHAIYRQRVKERTKRTHNEWRKRNRDKENDYRIRRRAIKKGSAIVEKVVRANLIAQYGSVCYLCNRTLAQHEITLDHLIPLSRGGHHSYENLRIACRSCNAKKHTRTLDEYLAF